MNALTEQKQVLEFVCENIDALPLAVKQLLAFCGETKVIAFSGNLGAGKTTFIKALCSEIGVSDTVSSPTFSIINEYRDNNNNPVYHFDFYRMKSVQEAEDTGCVEYFFSGSYCFVEWYQLVENLLPDEYVTVEITVENETRKITANKISEE